MNPTPWYLMWPAIAIAVLAGAFIGILEGKRRLLEQVTGSTRLVMLDAWTGDVNHGAPAHDAVVSSSIARCERTGWHPSGECGLLREVRVYHWGERP